MVIEYLFFWIFEESFFDLFCFGEVFFGFEDLNEIGKG